MSCPSWCTADHLRHGQFHTGTVARGDVAGRRMFVSIVLWDDYRRVFVNSLLSSEVASIPAEPACSWGSMLTFLGVPAWVGDAVAEGVRLLTAGPPAGPAPDDAGLAPDASSTSSPEASATGSPD